MMDTVTGVGHEYHSYEVRGVVHRHFYSDIESSSPLRIHRTPNVFYANLLDQVVPDNITIHITETHALKVTPTASDAINYNNPLPLIFRKEHVILHQSYTVQPPARALLPESLDFDYSSTIPVHLPRDFHACTQDVQSELIKVHHNLRFNVEFEREREDETESSQQNKFTGTIPFRIYMSPCTVMHHDVVYQQNLQELERELGIGHGEPLPPYRQREHSHPHPLSGNPPT
ncbi:resistance to o-dinitrobenzene [Aspergillus niger]